MKKLIFLAVLLAGISASASVSPDVNEKVLKAFNETFAGALNVNWTEKENKNYEASFSLSEIQVRATYDDEGNLLERVRYYGERILPPNVLGRIKKKYPGKEIFGVTEISSDTDVAYHITLKDEKN